jgi:membrane fusion protein (multidrug efflux system)
MTRQMRRMLLSTGIFITLIFSVYAVKKLLFLVFMASYEPPAVTVSSTVAKEEKWQSYLTSVGTLKAVNGTDISSEVSGIVQEIRFQSGQYVKQGDALVLLDSGVEQAELNNAESQLKLAQINFDRNKTLLKKTYLSQAEFDTSSAKLEEAQASLQGIQARLRQKAITAPFTGKIGIRLINVGQYLAAGTPMVTLQALDPLYVQFNLPEQYLGDVYLGQTVTLNVNLNSGSQIFKGEVNAINSKVDQNTRNVLVQAIVPNPDARIYPGMFANVTLWLRAKNNVLTLPQTAISYSLHGDSVFIIKNADNKHDKKNSVLHAFRQYVKTGERRQNDVVIQEGLHPGDVVVTAGQLKLQNGTHVIIDNSVEL